MSTRCIETPTSKVVCSFSEDSFVGALMPFFAQNFGEVHRYSAEEINGAVVAQYRPSAVIFETVERHADRLLRPPINLPQLCDK